MQSERLNVQTNRYESILLIHSISARIGLRPAVKTGASSPLWPQSGAPRVGFANFKLRNRFYKATVKLLT